MASLSVQPVCRACRSVWPVQPVQPVCKSVGLVQMSFQPVGLLGLNSGWAQLHTPWPGSWPACSLLTAKFIKQSGAKLLQVRARTCSSSSKKRQSQLLVSDTTSTFWLELCSMVFALSTGSPQSRQYTGPDAVVFSMPVWKAGWMWKAATLRLN